MTYSTQPNQEPSIPSANPVKTTETPGNPPKPASTEIRNVSVVPVAPVISVIVAIATILVSFLIYTNSKIDSGNQEIRNLINSGIRDYNNRIDNTNTRIDQVYRAPAINPS